MEYEAIKNTILNFEKSDFLYNTIGNNVLYFGTETERTIKEIMTVCSLSENETIDFIVEVLKRENEMKREREAQP